MSKTDSRDIVREFQEAPLPDARLQERLTRIAKAVEARPDGGFPQMFATEAELEAFYRFVRNDRVQWEDVLEPHIRETVRRMGNFDTVVVAHDTSEFRFGGHHDRDGLTRGRTGSKKAGARAKQGFLCHFALAVVPNEHRAPVGVVAMYPWARKTVTPTALRNAGRSYAEVKSLPSEQDRWASLVDVVEQRIGNATNTIHVMDSEADDYSLLAKLTCEASRFVIRACYDRVLADQQVSGRRRYTKEFVAEAQSVCTRRIKVSSRTSSNGRPRKREGARVERETTLTFKAASVVFRRPSSNRKELPERIQLNVVYVQELEPPNDVEPVEWLLVTTEPVDTKSDILQVVDYYRARWRVEEFFKAIKSGCAYEKRQLESLDTLLIALAVFIPVAWQLLHLRTLCRTAPNIPAKTCLTSRQLKVLRLACNQLPNAPTVRDALLQIARLGGHLKRNGEPGWQTLGRGFLELLALERGFLLTSNPARCDQS